MSPRDAHGFTVARLSPGGAAAVRSLLKRHLQRAPITSMFERNAAAALAALVDDGVDPRAARLIARHTALTGLPASSAPPATAAAGDPLELALNTGAQRTPDEWAFCCYDTDRSFGFSNHAFAMAIAFFGYGPTAHDAAEEARRARRPDFIEVFAEDPAEKFIAVRTVDLHPVTLDTSEDAAS